MSNILKSDKNDRKKKNFSVGIALLILLAIAILTYLIFEKSGHWLVKNDNVEHTKWVAILDGQSADLERSDYAAQLLKEGKADSVLILGRRIFRERSNSEFYADDFMKLGAFDSNAVFLVPHNDPSTISEAYSLIPWLKKRNADTVLLLTDAASTYRVKRIFKKLSGNSPVYVTRDIHHYTYNPNCWYNNRESRKNWLRSWASLFASYIDLFNTDTLEAVDSSYYKPIKTFKEFKREIQSHVNLQKLLPKIEDKIKIDSEKESTNETIKDSAKEISKSPEKVPTKEELRKEQPKDNVVKKNTNDTSAKDKFSRQKK